MRGRGSKRRKKKKNSERERKRNRGRGRKRRKEGQKWRWREREKEERETEGEGERRKEGQKWRLGEREKKRNRWGMSKRRNKRKQCDGDREGRKADTGRGRSYAKPRAQQPREYLENMPTGALYESARAARTCTGARADARERGMRSGCPGEGHWQVVLAAASL